MRVVNVILVLLVIAIVVTGAGLAYRGMSFARYARGDWHTWAVSETADALIFDGGGSASKVTVCNSSFRRSTERHDVRVSVGRGDDVEVFDLASRGCATVWASRVQVLKPEGETFATTGRYKVARGGDRHGFFGARRMGREGRMFERRLDDDAAADSESGEESDTVAPPSDAED